MNTYSGPVNTYFGGKVWEFRWESEHLSWPGDKCSRSLILALGGKVNTYPGPESVEHFPAHQNSGNSLSALGKVNTSPGPDKCSVPTKISVHRPGGKVNTSK